jgi:hypothetical protein
VSRKLTPVSSSAPSHVHSAWLDWCPSTDCAATAGVLTVAAATTCTIPSGAYTYTDVFIAGTATLLGNVTITATSTFYITSSGRISGDAVGFSQNTSPFGCTTGGSSTGGVNGGYPSGSSASGVVGIPCTSFEWPITGGGGGVSGSTRPGGAGGGSLVVIANATAATAVQVNGTISMNGAAGSADCSSTGGGGAGGSVAIAASIFSGVGSIQARGGNAGACVVVVYRPEGL